MTRMLLTAVTIGLLTLLTACGDGPGKVYPLDAASAAQRVAATEVPMMIFGSAAATSLDTSVSTAPGAVAWFVTADGEELFHYTATLVPTDATHTRVDVTVTPATTGAKAARIAQGFKDNPDIIKLYRDAMTEAVAAKLENRPFAFAGIAPAMTIAVIGRFSEINANFDHAIAEHDKQRQSYFQKAYALHGLTY